jgi:hypothetical protein
MAVKKNIIKVLSNIGNQATVSLTVFDKKENTTVYEDVFNIEVPPTTTTTTTTAAVLSKIPFLNV